ncbi:MAG: Gfo/Idh/MocA family oxidoreductase [Verrucomicrobiota bacterium]|nr:Gfo/Idh/MocA family oxidoreductase [Verrucomicrobiota bacterium]
MGRIKFGILGCGRIFYTHVEAISQNEGSVLTAVCDIDSEKVDKAAAEINIKAYYDYEEMLKDADIDAVAICTPSGLHPEHGILAAKYGKAVITEKPMAITLPAADSFIKTCDKYKTPLFVVKQNRLNMTMQLLKRAVEKNRFGNIYAAHVNVFWQRPQDYYDSAKWRGTWEFDGGAFMNQASHYVDIMHWLFGEAESVMAMTATMSRKVETEDTGSAIIKFRSGLISSINVTMLTYPKNFEGSITILGEKGTVKVGGVAINHVDKWEFEDYDDDDKLVTTSNYNPPNIYGFGHTGYYKNVLDVLNGNAEPDTDGRSGRKSLEIIRAIYLSAKEGVKIPLPLNRR